MAVGYAPAPELVCMPPAGDEAIDRTSPYQTFLVSDACVPLGIRATALSELEHGGQAVRRWPASETPP